jgi:hypothetical protein
MKFIKNIFIENKIVFLKLLKNKLNNNTLFIVHDGEVYSYVKSIKSNKELSILNLYLENGEIFKYKFI